MDGARVPEGDVPAEPDAAAVAALRERLPEELAHLPLTSAAEFRREAWKAWHSRPVANGWYYPPVGIRGVLAIMTGAVAVSALVMLVQGPSSSAGVLETSLALAFSGTATVLLVWSKWAANREIKRLQRRNAVLSEVSRRIDREVEAGRIPLKPAGWDGEVFGSLWDVRPRK